MLPKEVDDMQRNLGQTDKQINTVNERLPQVVESLDKLPQDLAEAKRKSDAIQSNLKKLNQQIDLARDIANRIKVGLKFFTNTTLELRNPKNLEALSTSSKFSGYFKTDQPKGLIFYIGNPNASHIPKQKSVSMDFFIITNILRSDITGGRRNNC